MERKIEHRHLRKILILCEGAKTEPNYFSKFPLDKNLLEVKGLGYVCDSLVEEAIRRKNQAEDRKNPYNQVWCVLDKDSNPSHNFHRAIQLGNDHKVRIAYSIEAFELWYILHFEYLQSGINRARYIDKISVHLKRRYKKKDKTMYDEISYKQREAINNAKRLLSAFPLYNNPSTTVHELVLELNRFIEI